ncbi:helix-turn-helix transcriptional regulator [Paractinoplanes deccanensis]|nr:helix-turn-helix transcriptional regulator [Actinoplanes deccanensis]
MADFLGVVPERAGMSFEEELAQLAGEWDDDGIRAEILGLRPGRLAATLVRPGLRAELLELLRWVWTVTVEADWPRRRRVLQADVVSRTAMLAAGPSGLPMGAVGNHLRVMLDAGLVLRRRAGREVLYWRTALGDSLVATGP